MQKIDLNPFREYLISRIGKGVTNGQKLFLEVKDLGPSYRLKDRIDNESEKLYGVA